MWSLTLCLMVLYFAGLGRGNCHPFFHKVALPVLLSSCACGFLQKLDILQDGSRFCTFFFFVCLKSTEHFEVTVMDGCSATMFCFSVVIVVTAGLVLVGTKILYFCRKHPKFPPAVPGLPLIGNLHQLKEKKPHLTFARWSEKYGPIYTIRTGASTVVVLNSTEIAKEAMVTRFPSISTRKLPKALTLLTANKAMVAMSDYDQFHKMAKRCILTSVLGPSAQKRHRNHRDTLVENLLNDLHSMIKKNPLQPVNLRELLRMELFSLALKQALGKDVESVYVEEFGRDVTKKEMFNILVTDPMEGAIEVDWRDFFPYLRWFPNKNMEKKIQQMVSGKVALTKALIHEQRKRIAAGDAIDCYLDFLLSEDQAFTEEQLTSLVWEAIIEASDTTLVTTEWAMFELARNPKYQDRLYCEIQEVCGSEKITEEHFPKLPYLSVAFHETLRRHSPVPIIPLRYAHEDTQLGGYHIPAGSEIAINLYACNSDKKMWDKPEEWNPERFLEEARRDSTDLYKTMAFGSGKRACAGSLQAMLISCAAIGRCIQEFHWELKEGEEEKIDTVQLTTHKLHPMLAYLKPRGISFANQRS